MRLPLRFVVIACATLAIGGCSHGTVSELPTAPTPASAVPAAPTVLRLIVTPSEGGTMIVGATANITSSGPPTVALGALADYTDGSRRFVEANWSSSDPNVVAIIGSSIKAMGRGTATLTATAQGHSASATFVVEPGIPGTWSGTFVVDQCAAGSGSMGELVCSALPGRQPGLLPVGSSTPITFVITQSGTALTATAALGQVRGALTGSDRGDNFLTLNGDLFVDRTTVTVTYWDSRVTVDTMEGFLGFEVRMAGIPSHANVTAHLVNVTRR
jgi:hypothetical protein